MKTPEILKRLDCWLRNRPYPEPKFFTMNDIDDLFEGRDERPWQTQIYWFFRSRTMRLVSWPGDTYRRTKWAYQRARYGWSERDSWSVYDTLDEHLPKALRQIKATKHGCPNEFFKKSDLDKNGDPTKQGFKRAMARFDKMIDAVIMGFEASSRLCSLDYDAELGENFYGRRPSDVPKEEWRAKRKERFDRMEVLMKRDEKIMNKGLALFAKYYHCLSD